MPYTVIVRKTPHHWPSQISVTNSKNARNGETILHLEQTQNRYMYQQSAFTQEKNYERRTIIALVCDLPACTIWQIMSCSQIRTIIIRSAHYVWIGKLEMTIREPAAVLVVGLQGCCSTSLFWDRTASVPAWCSSASHVFKFSNYDRSHADRWARAHCLRRFGLLWGLPQQLL